MVNNQANDQPLSVDRRDKPARSIATRLLCYTIFVLVLLVLGVYAWKILAVRSLEQEMEFQRSEMAQENQQALDVQARDMMRMVALPLAWAVRAEMMRGNLSQVDDYFRDFVKEPGVQSVLLIDKENQVVLATNRKLEAQSADRVVSKSILGSEDIVVEQSESDLRLAVPIMSFNKKIGILVMDYRPRFTSTPQAQQ